VLLGRDERLEDALLVLRQGITVVLHCEVDP
jgi:hypothetical protein